MRRFAGLVWVIVACGDDVGGVASGDDGSSSPSSSAGSTTDSDGASASGASHSSTTADATTSTGGDTSGAADSTTSAAEPCGCEPGEVCIEHTTDACTVPHTPNTHCIPLPDPCADAALECDSQCGWHLCAGPGCLGAGVEVCGALSEGFVCRAGGFACNLYAAEPCPMGEKCASWSSDGDDTFDATRCSPLTDVSPAIGEPCIFEGSPYSGIDNCEAGAMCLLVDPSDQNSGRCRAACVGDPYDATCVDPAMTCVIEGDYFGWCLPS